MQVNAQHIKTVPGRKTDMKDAQWIAELLQHGLLRASFVPSWTQRELREVTRYREPGWWRNPRIAQRGEGKQTDEKQFPVEERSSGESEQIRAFHPPVKC